MLNPSGPYENGVQRDENENEASFSIFVHVT